MCDPVSIGVALGFSGAAAGAVGTAVVVGGSVIAAKAMAPKPPSMPALPAPVPPTVATQGSKQPGVAQFAAANAAGGGMPGGLPGAPGGSGTASTMLTGPSGVDLSTLKLGKNTLLGS